MPTDLVARTPDRKDHPLAGRGFGWFGALLVGFSLTGAALAAPETSPRPQPRPVAAEVGMAAATLPLHAIAPLEAAPSVRPRPRPVAAVAPGLPGRLAMLSAWPPVPVPSLPHLRPRPRPDLAAVPDAVILSTSGLRQMPRPVPRPRDLILKASAAARLQPVPDAAFGRKGSVCGVDAIKGRTLAPILSRVGGCGVDQPVSVSSVQGVALSMPATMDCPTAQALNAWVRDAVLPQVGSLGGGVKRLEVAGHYVCRTRNNQPGARISEHGRGRAIDISGITLKDGTTLTVLRDWGGRTHGALMKALHKAACGPFGTVLGPASDRHHRDHFHFDTARYRSGRFCR